LNTKIRIPQGWLGAELAGFFCFYRGFLGKVAFIGNVCIPCIKKERSFNFFGIFMINRKLLRKYRIA